VTRPTYDDQARLQTTAAAESKPPNLQALLNGNDTWTVQ
jgi:2-oxoglutarate ferredoxin oxidoreductase subunit beta